MNIDDLFSEQDKKKEPDPPPPKEKSSVKATWEVAPSQKSDSKNEKAQAEPAEQQDATAIEVPVPEPVTDFAGKRVVLTRPEVAPAVFTSEMRSRITQPGKPGFLVIAVDGALYFEPDGAEAVPIMSGGVAGLYSEVQKLLESRARVLCLLNRDEDSGEYVFDFPRAPDMSAGGLPGSDAVRRLAGKVKSRVAGLRETRVDD